MKRVNILAARRWVSLAALGVAVAATPRIASCASAADLVLAPPAVNNLGTFSIVLNPDASLSANPAALAAFQRAAQKWQSYFSDPITVTIDAGLDDLHSATTIGSTTSVQLSGSFNTIRNAMVTDAATEPDDAVVAFLPTASTFTASLPTGFALDGNLRLTKANAKALGFTGLDATFGVSDATITFNSTFAFDFDRSDGITPGTLDFEAVATHEIGHALGFVSTVDDIDTAVHSGQTITSVEPTTLDLFRFDSTNDPSTLADFATTSRSLVPGATAHFDQITSAFGGASEVPFSTGFYEGDGSQASHWKDNLGLGIMDPTLGYGELSNVTPNDVRAFDLIGYDAILVPEPASLALFAALPLILRRRR